MLEREIEAWLAKQIKGMGCLYEKFVSPGKRGVSDRIVTIPGRPASIIFVELKREGETETPLQKRQRLQRVAMGVDARLVIGMAEAQAFAKEVQKICYTNRINISSMVRMP